MPPFYVGLCHIRPKTGLAENVMERFAALVKDSGGIVRKVNNSGTRPLPTEMRGKGVGEKHKFASIATVEFLARPNVATSVTETIRGLDDVIRVNLLRADDILARPPHRAKKTLNPNQQQKAGSSTTATSAPTPSQQQQKPASKLDAPYKQPAWKENAKISLMDVGKESKPDDEQKSQ